MPLDLAEPRFLQVCGLFLEERSHSCARRTMTSYEEACRLDLVPALGHLPTGEITRRHVVALHSAIVDQGRPSAANRAIVVGRMVWRFAERHELVGVGRNPFELIRRAATPQKRRPILPEEGRELWAVCEQCLEETSKVVSPVHAGYFLALLLTGLRMREGTHLRHEEFDRTRGQLRITHHKTSRISGIKVLDLSPDGVAHFSRLQDQFRWDETFFFPSKRSRRGHIEDPWRPWQRLCAEVGIEGATIHDIRRGFASAALNAGVDLRVVQDLLGHASIATTAKYAVPNADTKRGAASHVTAAFRPKEGGSNG